MVALLEMLVVRGLSATVRVDCMHGGYHPLFNRNRVGCRKCIPKGLIERLFVPLALALAANRIVVPANFVFWLGDHLDLLDHIPKISGFDGN